MKVKNIILGIKSKEDFLKEVLEDWEKLEKNEAFDEKDKLYFENINALRKALTPLRLEILMTIREKKPNSIYDLAKMLKKDVSNIYDHVMYLAENGFIELEKKRDGRENTVPIVRYDEIDIRIPISHAHTRKFKRQSL